MAITVKKKKVVATGTTKPRFKSSAPLSRQAKQIILELAAQWQPNNLILWELGQAGFSTITTGQVYRFVVKAREDGFLPKFHPGTGVRCHRGRDGNVMLRSGFYDARARNRGRTHFNLGARSSDDNNFNNTHFSFASQLFHSSLKK